MAHSKLTTDLINKASKYISEGHYTNVICQYLGIAETTFYSYVNQGKEDIEADKDTIYTKFLKSVKEAEAIAEMKQLQNILKASSDGTWQASAWYLERKHKNRWSTKQEIEHTGNQTIRVEITDDD
jgi:hypothetical protein